MILNLELSLVINKRKGIVIVVKSWNCYGNNLSILLGYQLCCYHCLLSTSVLELDLKHLKGTIGIVNDYKILELLLLKKSCYL